MTQSIDLRVRGNSLDPQKECNTGHMTGTHQLPSSRPTTPINPEAEVLHGMTIVDPYRWLEEQTSPATRKWIKEQTNYARLYLDKIPLRNGVKQRVTELLSVDTWEIPRRVGDRYFFRKRLAQEEQPCIYMRINGETQDVLLVDPSTLENDPYTSISISQVSTDGRLLLYEVKRGGERSGRFDIFDVDRRQRLTDSLGHGFLRGFVFAPDTKGFYYTHELVGGERPFYRAAFYHAFGTTFDVDEQIFFAGESPSLRLSLSGDNKQLFLVKATIGETTPTEYYFYDLANRGSAKLAFTDTSHLIGISLWEGRVFTGTDSGAPNGRILEMIQNLSGQVAWREVVSESSLVMKSFTISHGHILVQYLQNASPQIWIFNLDGEKTDEVSFQHDSTTTVDLGNSSPDEIFYKKESFTSPPVICRYLRRRKSHEIFAQSPIPVRTDDFVSARVCYPSKDGTLIPMHLVAKKHVLPNEVRPTILTGYGGFGRSMTPRFGVLSSFMIEQGCLFALTSLRGGSEFGREWHLAARGRNRQTAFDDFISGAEWLVASGYTAPQKLAILGGSNSGLLVGVALTQRPDLFRAVVCLGPLLDMLRYHHFDFARKYRDEYGIAEDPADFEALHAYSPYHHVKNAEAYPAVLMISGDLDMNCNPMHARKMTARLQAASISQHPVILDYKPMRGHKPVLPLSERIEGLTDRLSFLCDQLGVSVQSESERTETEVAS